MQRVKEQLMVIVVEKHQYGIMHLLFKLGVAKIFMDMRPFEFGPGVEL